MTKIELYEQLIASSETLICPTDHIISVMANVSALIQNTFGFHWTGFYFVDGERLCLGPFQGPIACTVIAYGKGVCGTCWKEGRSVVVEDVDNFPGHIACSPLSRSEIVIPLFSPDNEVFAVLDIDSSKISSFDEIDKNYLELLCSKICKNVN